MNNNIGTVRVSVIDVVNAAKMGIEKIKEIREEDWVKFEEKMTSEHIAKNFFENLIMPKQEEECIPDESTFNKHAYKEQEEFYENIIIANGLNSKLIIEMTLSDYTVLKTFEKS